MSGGGVPTYQCLICGRTKKVLPLMPRIVCNECHASCDERAKRRGILKDRAKEKRDG
jgi:hypothetical protein